MAIALRSLDVKFGIGIREATSLSTLNSLLGRHTLLVAGLLDHGWHFLKLQNLRDPSFGHDRHDRRDVLNNLDEPNPTMQRPLFQPPTIKKGYSGRSLTNDRKNCTGSQWGQSLLSMKRALR